MRIILVMLVVGVAFLVGVAVTLVRTMPHTPIERWHVDPLAVANPGTPNFYRVAPQALSQAPVDAEAQVYRGTSGEVAKAFDEFVLRQRDTQRIAGTPEGGWMTYVQRSELFKFPDYVSVKFIDLGKGSSTLAIFSRARLGYGDMGVNKARVTDWLKSLEPLQQ